MRGTIDSTSRYSAGAWSLPPIGPRPSRLGHAEAGRRVGVGRAAGRRVGDLEPERLGDGARVVDQPPAPLELLHRPPAGHRRELDGRVRDDRRLGDAPDLRLGRLERFAGHRADVHLERAALGHDVRPRPAGDRADVDGHARPAAVELVEVLDDPGRLEDRAPALLGFDAGVGGPTVDGQAQVEDALARRHDVAVRAGAFEHERDVHLGRDLDDVRGRGQRADLLVRVGDEHEPLERQAAALGDDRLERVQPGQKAGLHVGDARAVGDAILDAERALGRGARVEDRVHVPDEQRTRRAGPAVERRHDRRPEATGGIRPRLDARPELGQEVGDPTPDAVDAGRRIAAAVDVDETLEVGEVGRQVGADGGPQAVEFGRGRERRGGGRGGHDAQSSGRPPASEPALGGLLSCPDRAPGRDPPP